MLCSAFSILLALALSEAAERLRAGGGGESCTYAMCARMHWWRSLGFESEAVGSWGKVMGSRRFWGVFLGGGTR